MPRPRWTDSSLSTKLIVAFISVTLIPLGVLGFLNARTMRTALIHDANTTLLGAATQTANSIEAFIRANLDAMRTEAQLPMLATYLQVCTTQQRHAATEQEVAAILRALSRKDPLNILSYALINRQGRTLVDTFAADIGTDRSHYSYVHMPLQTGLPYVSPIQFSQTRQASLYFSSPVRDAKGKTVGILAVRYNAAVLQQLLIQTNGLAGEQSFAILLDEHYFRLAHGIDPDLLFTSVVNPAPDRVTALKKAGRWPVQTSNPKRPTALPSLKQHLATMAGDHPFFTTRLIATGRAQNSVAVSALETLPWVVMFAQPQDVFLAPIRAQTSNTLILAAVLAAGVADAAIFLAYTLSVPVIRLTRAAESVAKGDLTVRAHVKSNDEIGTLAAAFNSMTQQLRETMAGLEQRIAERTWTAAELHRRTVQLEAANTELDAFAYSISHDLRAPLRGLAGFSRALMEDYRDKLTGEALDYLHRIDRASQRMGQMIDDLLTLSRSTRGELRWERVELSALATAIAAELSDYASERQVTWQIESQIVTQGDPRLLRIVLENLLHNAWKFTSKHETATIAFEAQQIDGETVYLVRDDGAGFDMAYADKLFGIFQRLHAMTEFEGNGIGLATVARLVHRHGGRIWAQGREEQGATFYFTLSTLSPEEAQTWPP